MVKVSIGVPVYNVEEYLRQCLNSIMEQTFTDFEVIMVDDGSTDNSFSICQEYVAKDNRFKLIHQENKGLAGARNTCIKNMHGEFITWIDSDDVIKPNYLEKLLQVQKETDAQIINCMFYYIKDGTEHYFDYTSIYPDLKRIELSGRDALKTVLFDKYKIIELAGTLVESSLYKGWYCTEGVMYEDFGSKFKLYPRANTVVAIPDQLYGYRQRDNGTIGKSKQQKTFSEELKISNDMISNIEKYVYYMELMDLNVRKIHEDGINYLTSYSLYRANMLRSEEDKQLYFEYVNKYKEKLKRYWNMGDE